MNLDDVSAFAKIDTQNMISEIDGLPDQLLAAWELGENLSLPDWDGIQSVLVSGMGGSAIGADLLRAYISPVCPVPVITQRNYGLPAWAKGPQTLVVISSHSGNTEENLSTYEAALEKGCRLLAVSTGGKLAAAAEEEGVPLWRFEHNGQPRAAAGYSFGLLLAVMNQLGFIPDPQEELQAAAAAMRAQQESLRAGVPVVENPAKRMAGQLFGRWVAVLGADILAPVARRWKGQISEIAKAWGQFEFLPESDHNTLAGLYNPGGALSNTLVLFLRAASYHPRNQLRTELTKKAFMLEGLNTDFIDAQGDTRLAHLWTALHFGDYTAYYLAMAYGVDPTPVEAIESFKQEMREAG